jgi:hypothetical protein
MKKCFIAVLIAILASVTMASAAPTNANRPLHLLGKMEANLWESAAAVYFYIADHTRKSNRIALSDYKDDIETMDRTIGAMESLNLTNKEKTAIAKIKKSWLGVKAMGNELININVTQEKAAPISDSKMHRYWYAVEELDNLIDEEIRAIAGDH